MSKCELHKTKTNPQKPITISLEEFLLAIKSIELQWEK